MLGERTFREDVGCLFSRLDKTHLDVVLARYHFNHCIKVDAMSPSDVSHSGCPLFETHFDDSVIVLQYDELGSARRQGDSWRDIVHL